MSVRSDGFVKGWVAENVRSVPGDEDGFREEVQRLCGLLVADSAAAGIDSDELNETVGDVTDYVTAAYENVYDPDAGFRD